MSTLLIELIVCITLAFLFYQCCLKKERGEGDAHDDDHDSGAPDDHPDLRRFRERMSERGREDGSRDLNAAVEEGGEDDNNNNNDAMAANAAAARKALVERNLFTRTIKREASVTELQQLLAISRGGGGGEVFEDEELGQCGGGGGVIECATAPTASSDEDANDNDDDPVAFDDPERTSSASSLPAPTAPPAPRSAQPQAPPAAAAAAAAPPPPAPSSSSSDQGDAAPPLAVIGTSMRNLWSNLAHNLQQGSERDSTTAGTAAITTTAAAATTPTIGTAVCEMTDYSHSQKLECSICLDHYSPGDTVAWAKDGGDPPTSLSSATIGVVNNNRDAGGCDHVFHVGCILSWLGEGHDECPLCRRKVVHDDADARFAGWESIVLGAASGAAAAGTAV